MPSIFSWRPSKLQIRLKKLSHQLGNNGVLSNGTLHSTDEEDEIEEKRSNNETRNKNKIHAKHFDELEQDIIVESAPPQRFGIQSSFSDDEYFYARSPAVNRSLKFLASPNIQNDEVTDRRRAVRFLEGYKYYANALIDFFILY